MDQLYEEFCQSNRRYGACGKCNLKVIDDRVLGTVNLHSLIGLNMSLINGMKSLDDTLLMPLCETTCNGLTKTVTSSLYGLEPMQTLRAKANKDNIRSCRLLFQRWKTAFHRSENERYLLKDILTGFDTLPDLHSLMLFLIAMFDTSKEIYTITSE